MAISRKDERSLLTHEERMLVDQSHHPAVDALSIDALRDLRRDLRAARNRERDMARHKARVVRGKAEQRGGSFPGTAERPKRRKQVFANALQRTNSAVERSEAFEQRQALVESQKKALALKRAKRPHHRPANSRTANNGPAAVENVKRRTRVPGARVGSISQQGKNAQARRDG